MDHMPAINARLRELEQIEKQMNTERIQVLEQRQLEDTDWYQRVQAHDAEEAVRPPMRCQSLADCEHKIVDVANVMAEIERQEETSQCDGCRWSRGSPDR
jgi:hypothetical protein